MSRIEQIISEIEEYIDNCKYQPLSNTKIVVIKEDIEDLLSELRLKIPDEIKKYQKIINNKDAIITDAKEQADTIISAAQVHTEELVNEHEIMQRAYAQANQLIEDASAQAQSILDRATNDANDIRIGAMQYTDDMLSNLQLIIEHSIETNKAKYESLLSGLHNDLNIVMNNRNELRPNEATPQSEDIAQSDEERDVLDTGDSYSEESTQSDEM